MTFEAFGVGFHNKGAELMLEAIRHQTMIWGAPLAAAPRVGSVRARRESRLLCLTRAARPNSLSGADIWAGLVATFPRPVRHAFGVERYSAVRVVLDASGYTYGDAWTVAHCEEGLDAARRVKANGGFFVLLPQAFGPFERPEIRSRCQELLSMSDLVYARDPESMRQVLSIGADPVRVRLAPDFTGLVPAAWSGASPGTVAIIPNSNMVARGDDPESYYAYLTAIVRAARAHGERPYLLVHAQDGDYEIARRVSASANDVPIVVENSALATKGLIGTATAVVSSRYHGIINAFSQRIPALGTSWSHKYRALFEEHDCVECLADKLNPARAQEDFARLIAEPARSELVRRLDDARQRIDAASQTMWDEIRTLVT